VNVGVTGVTFAAGAGVTTGVLALLTLKSCKVLWAGVELNVGTAPDNELELSLRLTPGRLSNAPTGLTAGLAASEKPPSELKESAGACQPEFKRVLNSVM
jgi:hypothetical protein